MWDGSLQTLVIFKMAGVKNLTFLLLSTYKCYNSSLKSALKKCEQHLHVQNVFFLLAIQISSLSVLAWIQVCYN